MSNNPGRKMARKEFKQWSYEEYTRRKLLDQKRKKVAEVEMEMIELCRGVALHSVSKLQIRIARHVPPIWFSALMEKFCDYLGKQGLTKKKWYLERYVGMPLMRLRQRVIMFGISKRVHLMPDKTLKLVIKYFGRRLLEKTYEV